MPAMDCGTRKGKSPYLAIEIGAVVVQAVLLGATKMVGYNEANLA